MYNPIPPESTTLAFFKAGNKSGVLSSIIFAAFVASSIKSATSVASISIAASAVALITDRIVPSVGLITALYAEFEPSFKATAIWAASASSKPSNPFDIPLNIWERITPELPLAPIKAPLASFLETSPIEFEFIFSISLTAALNVIDI